MRGCTTPALAKEALAELPADIADSPLFNPDLAPVPKGRRNWTTYNFAALWISMAHCIPTYMMAGSLVRKGMNWWQALLTILLGNLIVLVPILLNAHPGTKYGIPFPVLARASFGTQGANVPAVLRAIVACGWFGIQTFIGGEAVRIFVEALWPGFAQLGGGGNVLGLTLPSAITFFVFWALNILIIFRGMNAVRVFENWAAPLVLVLALALLIWAVNRAGGVGPMLTKPSSLRVVRRLLGGLRALAHRHGRLLGHALVEHSRLHALRSRPARTDARPDARPAHHDGRVFGDGRGHHQRLAGDSARRPAR